jgi:membrane-associated phospholipid phosphatase
MAVRTLAMVVHASKKDGMMLTRAAFVLSFLIGGAGAALADEVENLGVDVAVALPAIAGGIAVYQGDWNGIGQLGVDTVATVGTAYALKHIVREERPDHSDFQSFPSDTAAVAFAPAQFLWDRYGWQVGVPAYAAATFVGWSRVESKQHHWYDVAASAGLAFGFSKLFTSRYRAPGLVYGVEATPDSAYVHLSYNF